MQVVGIIPARGGSKGIPRKHLHQVQGRPLLAYTADAALASQRLTRVIVSTDDGEIAEAARSLGLDVPFLRPASLAADDTPMLPVLRHAAQQLAAAGSPPDVLVLLQPTSPLRRASQIDAAVDLLEQTGADSVVSVVDVPHQFNPVSVMRLEGNRLVPFLAGGGGSGSDSDPDLAPPLRRQDKPRVFARNGPAIVAVRRTVCEGGSLYGSDIRPLLMPPDDSLDIDTPADLELLDYYLARRR